MYCKCWTVYLYCTLDYIVDSVVHSTVFYKQFLNIVDIYNRNKFFFQFLGYKFM